MYETYSDKLQPYFGLEKIHLHYMDSDSFILSVNTKDIIKDLKNLEDIFDICNIDKNHKLFSDKNKKSDWKTKKFGEYKKCLDGEEHQEECNHCILRSIIHEMHLQEIKKSTLSIFDDKRCFINNIESKPWNYYY